MQDPLLRIPKSIFARRALLTRAKPMAKLNPKDFPRPPLCEPTTRHVRVEWEGQVIADSKEAYWVLETFHPPTYYFPPASIKATLLPSDRSTFCEWKGSASYWNLSRPSDPKQTISNRIWSYARPTPPFANIKDYLCFYAGPWDCFVDGEKVEPQPGDFYGGWVTSDLEQSTIKGRAGTNWW